MNRRLPAFLSHCILWLLFLLPVRGANDVPLILEGNAQFDEAALREVISDQLNSIKEEGLSPAMADDAAFFLNLYYRKAGYSQSDVNWKILPGNRLLLQIREGALTRLGEIRFEGNTRFSSEQLLEYVIGKEEDRPKNQAFPFSETQMRDAAGRIQAFYQQEGYLDAFVDEPVITLSADQSRADVLFLIEEGIQYHYGQLIFEGDLLFERETMMSELGTFLAQPFTPGNVVNMERKLRYLYLSRGYFKVKITSEADPELAVNGKVDVRFKVEAGAFYRFDGVSVSGLDRLRPRVLEKRFASLKGQPYSPAKVEERHRKLMATGLFSDLRINQKALPTNEVALGIKAKEAKAREVGFHIGYGTLEGAIIGARYLDRNLFGFGRPFSANAEIAQNLLRGEVLYTDPWLFDSDYTLRLRLYALKQYFKDYEKLEAGFHAELARKFGKHFEASLFFLARGVNIINSGGFEEEDLGKANYIANSIGLSLTLDYRDSVLNPSKGWVFNATADFASSMWGSSINTFRTTGRASYYQPIGKTLLAIGLRGGVIVPLDDGEDLPIDERFFNGGSRSIRSYVERSMGPKDRHGRSLGGETFYTLNIEHIFPLYGDGLKGAVFFDAGNVTRFAGEGGGVNGYAVGLGIRYFLPIGPIRLDYGFNPAPGPKKPTGAWNLSVGFAF